MEFLPTIGAKLGIQLETEDTMALRLVKSIGMPSVKLLVSGVRDFPELIHLPLPGGGRIDNKKSRIPRSSQSMLCLQAS
jgi:hypothetical protein